MNKELVNLLLAEHVLTCLLELRRVRIFHQSRHHGKPARLLELRVSEVVCLKLFLLPDASSYQNCEYNNVLKDLNVQLRAPSEVEQTDQVD